MPAVIAIQSLPGAFPNKIARIGTRRILGGIHSESFMKILEKCCPRSPARSDRSKSCAVWPTGSGACCTHDMLVGQLKHLWVHWSSHNTELRILDFTRGMSLRGTATGVTIRNPAQRILEVRTSSATIAHFPEGPRG